MTTERKDDGALVRRDFFRIAGAGVAAAAAGLSHRGEVAAQETVHKAALERIASNSYPIRPLFKQRANAGGRGGRGGANPAAGRGAGAA
ncbi:MAG: hypothetical protein ACRD1U_05550, partial [Vicinamibacterales bacterium]